MFLKKKNFFNDISDDIGENIEKIDIPSIDAEAQKATSKRTELDLSVQDDKVLESIHLLEDCCKDAKRKDLLEQLESLRAYLSSAKFTVAVVGEFNRGKSTLVNQIIDSDIIPTSIIPTTASIIRVSGGQEEEGIVFKHRRGEQKYPLNHDSWDKIESEKQKLGNLSYQVLIKRNCPILLENDIEIIDTPGVNSQIAGDLTIAEQAISECDCAILPMDATQAFSSSEKMFLQERLLMKKIPRIMVVLTKLDLVAEQGRNNVVEMVRDKLSTIGSGIPLYLSSTNMVDGWDDYSGIEAIKSQLLQWLSESNHSLLKKERAITILKTIATSLSEVYSCQLDVLVEKEDKEKIVAEKKKKQFIRDSQIQWETLEIDMLNRCNRNFEWIRSMTEERQGDIIEKLLLELSHVNIPKEWWERDYPYRIKMEMIALGNMLENNLQNFYTRDIGWLNHQLQEKYGVSIPPCNQRIADKTVFRNPMLQESFELEDMRRSRTISRVGTGALTIAGYAIGGVLGFSPIGMAIGLGSGIVSEIFMNKRIDAQKNKLSAVIREKLPEIIGQCIATVENNVREYYVETINSMKASCVEWAKIKSDAIDAARTQGNNPNIENDIRIKLSMLKKITEI